MTVKLVSRARRLSLFFFFIVLFTPLVAAAQKDHNHQSRHVLISRSRLSIFPRNFAKVFSPFRRLRRTIQHFLKQKGKKEKKDVKHGDSASSSLALVAVAAPRLIVDLSFAKTLEDGALEGEKTRKKKHQYKLKMMLKRTRNSNIEGSEDGGGWRTDDEIEPKLAVQFFYAALFSLLLLTQLVVSICMKLTGQQKSSTSTELSSSSSSISTASKLTETKENLVEAFGGEEIPLAEAKVIGKVEQREVRQIDGTSIVKTSNFSKTKSTPNTDTTSVSAPASLPSTSSEQEVRSSDENEDVTTLKSSSSSSSLFTIPSTIINAPFNLLASIDAIDPVGHSTMSTTATTITTTTIVSTTTTSIAGNTKRKGRKKRGARNDKKPSSSLSPSTVTDLTPLSPRNIEKDSNHTDASIVGEFVGLDVGVAEYDASEDGYSSAEEEDKDIIKVQSHEF